MKYFAKCEFSPGFPKILEKNLFFVKSHHFPWIPNIQFWDCWTVSLRRCATCGGIPCISDAKLTGKSEKHFYKLHFWTFQPQTGFVSKYELTTRSIRWDLKISEFFFQNVNPVGKQPLKADHIVQKIENFENFEKKLEKK